MGHPVCHLQVTHGFPKNFHPIIHMSQELYYIDELLFPFLNKSVQNNLEILRIEHVKMDRKK